jgi:serine O-acetyltransferase
LCDKIYGLLKIFSSSDIFYEVNLPQIFSCDHPHGTVLGRASYSNYFVFSHGCTVGGNKDIYPKIDERVAMMSNSKIIGHCFIGRNVIISANCYIKDIDIPSNSIVFGQSPNLIIKSNKKFIDEYFESIFLLNKQNQHF